VDLPHNKKKDSENFPEELVRNVNICTLIESRSRGRGPRLGGRIAGHRQGIVVFEKTFIFHYCNGDSVQYNAVKSPWNKSGENGPGKVRLPSHYFLFDNGIYTGTAAMNGPRGIALMRFDQAFCLSSIIPRFLQRVRFCANYSATADTVGGSMENMF
jgi:hypothetical protein